MIMTKVWAPSGGMNRISELCDLHGSDKGTALTNSQFVGGWAYHDYTSIYEMMFYSKQLTVKSVLEIGIGTNNPTIPSSMGPNGSPGASLRVWRDYFPLAEVVGIDIDKNILFTENRIHTFQCDQTDPIAIGNFFKACPLKSFDIIIDDGLHTEEAAQVFFENSWNKLAPTGFYFIEDAAWWEGGEINFLEKRKLKYYVFGDPIKAESDLSFKWNKLIMIIK
jgi:SAM-dependent methyltransferase